MSAEAKVFFAGAHPDDDVMMAQHLSHLGSRGVSLDMCFAVDGRAGGLYGQPAEQYFNVSEITDDIREQVGRIRRQELELAMQVYDPSGGSRATFLELDDKGWKQGGISGQEQTLNRRLLDSMEEGDYDAFLFPLSLAPWLSPSGWSHPDHVAVSGALSHDAVRRAIGDRPLYRYVFYNEHFPLINVPDEVQKYLRPETLRYGPGAFAIMQSLVDDCYSSQSRTLWSIIAQTTPELSANAFDPAKIDEYADLGSRGPDEASYFQEVLYAEASTTPPFHELFGTPDMTERVGSAEQP